MTFIWWWFSALCGVEICFFFCFFSFPLEDACLDLIRPYSGLGPTMFIMLCTTQTQKSDHSVRHQRWSVWGHCFRQARGHLGTKAVIQILIYNGFGLVLSKGPVLPPVRDLLYRKRPSAEIFFGAAQNMKYDWLMCKINHQHFTLGSDSVQVWLLSMNLRCGFTLLSQRKWWNGGCFSEVTCCCCQMNHLAVRCLIF